MKKSNKKEILFLIIFAVVLVLIEIFLPRLSKENLKEKNNYSVSNEYSEEIDLGDYNSCMSGCMSTCLSANYMRSDANTYCSGVCSTKCNPSTRYCCCSYSNGRRTYCSNSSSCLSPGIIMGTNISDAACQAYVQSPVETSTPAPTPEPCKIRYFSQYNIMSSGEEETISVSLSGSCSKRATITGKNGITVVGENRIRATGGCNSVGTYTVTVDNDSRSQNVLITNKWISRYNFITSHLPSYDSKKAADLAGSYEYGSGCYAVASGKYFCAEYGWRGCGEPGTTPPDPPPPIDPIVQAPGCYADASSLDKATRANWQSAATSAYPTKVEKFPGTNLKLTKETCKPLEKITICTPALTTSDTKKVSADKCEDNISVPYTDGKTCNGNSFYKIECKNNKVNIKYDNGDDKDNGNSIKDIANLLPGQGFELGIEVEIIKDGCKATFDANSWLNVYNKIQSQKKLINTALKLASVEDKKVLNSRLAELNTKLEKLKQIAKDYNSESKNINLNMGMNFKMKYPTNNGSKTLETDLLSTVIDEGKFKTTVTKTSTLISDELIVKNYTWTNKDNPMKLKLTFPRTYINPYTGDVAKTSKDTIDGGNKLYINYDAKTGKQSTMNINIVGKVDKKEVMNITNQKCKIEVFPIEIKYRPIDLDNPFINKDYRKGENWINEKYDFTKAIHTNTWSEKALYDISLDNKLMDNIKENNEKNKDDSPYLGLCERIKPGKQDSITKTICGMLN